MTIDIDEIIECLEHMIKWGDPYEVDTDACKMAIKALKQYGVLQEVRQEIDRELLDYATTIENIGDSARQVRISLGMVRAIIDKHIKQIERSNTEREGVIQNGR